MIDSTRLMGLLLGLPLFMFALTVHEVAHGWVARKFGDPTAEQEGRLTLNPLAHLDPMGTLMFVISSLVGFGFGWAKPVPVRLGNAREPLKAMWWVSLAGPLSNLLQAAVALLVLVLMRLAAWPVIESLALVMSAGLGALVMGGAPLQVILPALASYYLIINLVLMLFNLLPIPPLDGGHALMSVVGWRGAQFLARLAPYGFIIVLALMYFGVTEWWIGWPLKQVYFWLVGLLA